MKTIYPVNIEDIDFSQYGCYAKNGFAGVDLYTVAPIYVGMVYCKSGSFITRRMERHFTVEEIQCCGNKSTILTLADSDPEKYPLTSDIVSIIINPGDVITLKKGIWHDINHAVSEGCFYYYFSNPSKGIRDMRWIIVKPEPVYTQILLSDEKR